MKKLFATLRSMRFGILLLILIAACSVIGTVIPQGREIAWYAQTYRSFHGILLLLRLDKVFQSWYFIALLALLCLNLTLCSVLRVRAVARGAGTEAERAAGLPDEARLSREGTERLREHLRAMRCREDTVGDAVIFRKHGFSRYGSFLIHLSILLTVIFGALALVLPTTTDLPCMPGDSVFLPDGTEIHVQDFHITDETGRLDYTSHIRITLPDGRRSETEELKVNFPFSFGPYKIFQQSFGTAGSMTVTDLSSGASDVFLLTEPSFLSADGINGLFYDTLYPDYIRDPDNAVTLITITEGSYPNPIYQFRAVSNGELTPSLAVPGDSLEIMGYRFAFNEPVEYPGLRVKHLSPTVNALLIASFALMIVGLYITFFLQPVLVKVDGEGYAVGGPKPEGLRLELAARLKPYVRTESSGDEQKGDQT